MNNKLNYIDDKTLTEKLSKLFYTYVDPEIIIIFICNNLYELIDESYDLVIKYESHEEFFENYANYYQTVIKTSEQPWLFTLFHFTKFESNFNLKNFYISISGKIAFFSEDLNSHTNYAHKNYWYRDSKNLAISWIVQFNEEMNSIDSMYGCKFLVVDKFLQSKADEVSLTNNFYHYIIYKSRWEDCRWDNLKNKDALSQVIDELIADTFNYHHEPLYDIYLYKILCEKITQKIKQYKTKVNQKEHQYVGYNQILNELCKNYLIENQNK